MRLFAATFAALSTAATAQADSAGSAPPRVAPPDVQAVAPALADYTDQVLFGDVWKRTDLSPRDRSFVTVSALIAGGHTRQFIGHLNRALDNGVKPAEIAALIAHLAFYAGWPNAVSAAGITKDVFSARKITPEQVAAVPNEPLPLDAGKEAARAAAVEAQAGTVAPALVDYTNRVLFGDLWRRADLAPRDRSLATIVALIVNGQVEQLPYHLTRGMESGLTRAQLSEVITHLAFYAGWPRAISAVPVAKTVFEAQNAPVENLEILRQGSQPTTIGAAENFTGAVQVNQRFQRNDPARLGGGIVTFQPGARTAWHTHPLGQTLIVTSGCGWVQQEGRAVEEIRPGDVVMIPPNTRHWHGATATTAMTHLAIAEMLDGKSVEWMEQVSDADYKHGAEKC
jgi:4-carboxymuconolactone decarboxylase